MKDVWNGNEIHRRVSARCGAHRDRRRLNATIIASSASVRTVKRGFLGPVFKSSTVERLRHLATVLALMPNSLLSCASEACDRCIAAQSGPIPS